MMIIGQSNLKYFTFRTYMWNFFDFYLEYMMCTYTSVYIFERFEILMRE
jgi:hypothetical protein